MIQVKEQTEERDNIEQKLAIAQTIFFSVVGAFALMFIYSSIQVFLIN